MKNSNLVGATITEVIGQMLILSDGTKILARRIEYKRPIKVKPVKRAESLKLTDFLRFTGLVRGTYSDKRKEGYRLKVLSNVSPTLLKTLKERLEKVEGVQLVERLKQDGRAYREIFTPKEGIAIYTSIKPSEILVNI